MRVCLFTDSFLPYISGVSSAVLNQANELAARGHAVSVFHPRPGKEDRGKPTPGLDPRIRVYELRLSLPVPKVPRLRFSIPLLWSSYRRLKAERPDVIHVHTEFGCGIEGLILGRRMKIPVVGTFHTFFAEPEYLKQFRLPDFEVTRNAMWRYSVGFFNRCSRVVSPSKAVRDSLVAHGLTTPATLLSNGIDKIAFRPKGEIEAYRRSLGIDDFSIIYVGRVSPEKSLDVVLEAFALLLKDNAKAKLVIVGNGPADGAVDGKIKELGIAASVIRTGRIERDVLMRENVPLLGDVFATASKTENQPVSLLEAMAFGLPMIGPRARGIPELVRDGEDGIVFEPDDVEGMAAAMRRLMQDDQLLKAMSAAALRHAAEHGIERTGEQLEAVYREAIDGK